MISLNSLWHLSRAFKKPIFNLLTNHTAKGAFFHKTKLLWGKIEIKMPSLSPTMTEGTIVKWLKKEGDPIEPGDVLCEIQTDKAVVGLETEEEGVLQKILIPENTQNIQLGEIIAIIAGEGDENVTTPTDPEPVISQKTVQKEEVPKSSDTRQSTVAIMGPSVKRLLDEFNIKYSDVPVSGPRRNILKGDVLKFIKDHNLKPVKVDVAPQPKKAAASSSKAISKDAYVDIPVSSSETENARQLIQSKLNMPHCYMSTDCTVDFTLKHMVNHFQKDSVDVSLDEFIVKSAVTALKKVPKLNSVRQNGQLKLSDFINIAITNFNDGEYKTSVINNAASLTVQSISEGMGAHTSKPTEGVFRISNLSSLGISNFVEIISPSDVATLAVSGIKTVFEDDTPVKKMRVTLSFDNYVVGETEAGEFLETFKNCLENPLTLMC